ncbi:MAG TPA: GNAT family N-acetyltransferase [Anaerolineales bacterium]|nr:GNAT family N-acetyltransferase [Anaerolineales bacterium]
MSNLPNITFILETERLLLRRLILDDLNDLFMLYSNPEIRKYFPEGVLTYEQTKEELEWFLNGHPKHPELGLWATIHKGTGKFIGRCGLLPWTIEGQNEVEIAYLLDKAFWKQGLGTEAAQGIQQYGFEQLKVSRLICMIDPGNVASQRVAERIGMTFEKKVDEYEGDHTPFFIYSINKKVMPEV